MARVPAAAVDLADDDVAWWRLRGALVSGAGSGVGLLIGGTVRIAHAVRTPLIRLQRASSVGVFVDDELSALISGSRLDRLRSSVPYDGVENIRRRGVVPFGKSVALPT
jgi:hypothetical protein